MLRIYEPAGTRIQDTKNNTSLYAWMSVETAAGDRVQSGGRWWRGECVCQLGWLHVVNKLTHCKLSFTTCFNNS